MIRHHILSVLAGAAGLFLLAGCTARDPAVVKALPAEYRIAVFVPGVVQGSPTYEMLVAGVREAAKEIDASGATTEVKVIEGGFNQAEWQNSIIALAAAGTYQLIVSSNPAMPAYCAEAAKAFPQQRFLILDAHLEGNPAILTIAFDQFQQAWLNGYFAAQVTSSTMSGANPELRIGLLAGQEYPVMNNDIRTGFLAGAQAFKPGVELDFRVLGSWSDAAKAEAFANDMIDKGADVILTIAGGGNQGVIAAARSRKTYVTWFDSPGYALAPGIVLGSTVIRLDKACQEAVFKAYKQELEFGKASTLGATDQYVSFDLGDPEFAKNVPDEIVKAQTDILDQVVNGKTVPSRLP